jgi:hypothetical protein
VKPLWKAIWKFLKKLKVELPYNTVILLLEMYPEEYTSGCSRDTHDYHSTVHNSQAIETPYN